MKTAAATYSLSAKLNGATIVSGGTAGICGPFNWVDYDAPFATDAMDHMVCAEAERFALANGFRLDGEWRKTEFAGFVAPLARL